MLRLAALTFWGLFLLCAFVAAAQPGFAAKVVGEHQIEAIEQMYDQPLDGSEARRSSAGTTRRWPASTSSTTPGSA